MAAGCLLFRLTYLKVNRKETRPSRSACAEEPSSKKFDINVQTYVLHLLYGFAPTVLSEKSDIQLFYNACLKRP